MSGSFRRRVSYPSLLLCWAVVVAGCTLSKSHDLADSVLSEPHEVSRSRVVAVVDGGIDRAHPSLSGVVTERWVAPGLPGGQTGHATQMAGLVAGRPGGGFVGGLGRGSTILDVRVLDDDGSGSVDHLAAGLLWAADHGADLVLTSLAVREPSAGVADAIDVLGQRGIPVVAAAGNGLSADPPEAGPYPAAYPGVISVAAADSGGDQVPGTLTSTADVVALGSEVLTTDIDGRYARVSGTSVAAALAAGLLTGCPHPLPRSDRDLAPFLDREVDVASRSLRTIRCPS